MQSVDVQQFSGGFRAQNILRGPAYPAESSAYITLGSYEVPMMRIPIFFLVGALMSVVVEAHTSYEADLVCPIGGEKFKAVLAGSGTSYGKFLDLKPYGPIAAPWPLAKCPANGFVMFQDKFSDTELSRLETFVASTQYQELKKTHTNYYLAASLQRQIDAPLSQLASTLLQATWEAPGGLYSVYAAEALEAYLALLKVEPTDSKSWVTYQLIAGELERRLGKFEAAANRFSVLKENPSLNSFVKGIIEFQLQLISEQNLTSQPIPSGKK
ncbi:MAG: hypothetical protein JNK28_05645 [Burkholderiaceae bacterium]|nr:hypothetical protein [Burkholderiaceae bacterium]